MTTDNPNHVLPMIDAYLAGGLDDAERKAFDIHVASCGDCAAAVDAARAANDRLADALVAALPLPAFEDRLIVALRPRMSRPSFVARLSRPIRHPAVRKIAVGLAASLVIGTVGFGMSVAVENAQTVALPNGDSAEPTVVALIDQARRLKDEGKYDAAKKVSEEILRLDPRNDYALGTLPLLDDKANFAEQKRYDDILRYPADWPDISKVRTDSRILEQDARSLAFRDSIYSKSKSGQRDDAILLPEDMGPSERRLKAIDRGTSADESGRPTLTNRTHSADPSKFFIDQSAARESNLSRFSAANEGRVREAVANQSDYVEGLGKSQSKSESGKLADGRAAPDNSFEFYSYNKATATPSTPTGESAGRADGTVALGLAAVDTNAPTGGPQKESGVVAANGPITLNYTDSPMAGEPRTAGGVIAGGLPALTSTSEVDVQRRSGVDPGVKNLGSVVAGAIKPADGPSDGWAGTSNERWYRPQTDGEKGKRNEELSRGTSLERAKEVKGIQSESTLAQANKAAESLGDTGGIVVLADGVEVAGGKSVTVTGGDKDADRLKTEVLYAGVELKNPDAAGTGESASPPTPGATPASKPPVAAVDPLPARVAPVQPPPPAQMQVRKVIRNGVVTFEVDSFDSALIQVTKLAAEEGGFVQTTSSDKLQNGKVRGSVTVRVPPDRLDTLVLKLRGMGDLKNQRISAEDVTKRYTDIESQLRAARAMEERLLAIIKNGGEVKDLLEAEKQLGVWREKLELLQGEMKYYDNLISLSTLVVELMERDVRTPTAAFEVETVNTAVETEDVETVRSEILKSIETAKGRVIDSDLKKLEAGQLSATIKATVAPDAAGPVIDRLKQLGKLARLDISRKTATEGGSGPIVPGLRVERKETQFEIHIYNLANIEPRQTTTLSLAAQDVEATYKQIIDQVKAAGGDIRTSQLNRPKADQTSGTIVFQAPADKADVLLGAIRTGVDVMRMDVATNPDARNTTEAKRGFSVQISSLSHVPARETTTLQVAAADVPASFRKLLDAATSAGGRVLTSQLNEQDATNITGTIEFETPRDKWPAIDTLLRDAGAIVSRSAVRSSDTENTVDSKLKLSISIMDEIRLSPRETINATVATRTVQETFDKLLAAAKSAGARVVGSNLNLADRARPTGSLRFAVPRENAEKFEQSMKDAGLTTSRAVARLPDGPMTVENKVGFIVTVVDERTLQARESQSMVVVAASASDRYAKLLEALRVADALVLNSQLSVQNKKDITGTLEFVINRSDRGIIDGALDGADVFNRNVDRSQDTQGTVDTKIRYAVTIREADQQPPRQIVLLSVQSAGIDKGVGDIEAAAIAAGGRKIEAERSRQDRKDAARVVIDVPLASLGQIITAVRGQGEVTSNQSRQNEAVPEGSLSRARIEVSYSTPPTAAADKGFGESLREGLSGALTGLFTILRWIIFGLVVIVPCLLIIWLAYKLVGWTRPRKRESQPAVTPA